MASAPFPRRPGVTAYTFAASSIGNGKRTQQSSKDPKEPDSARAHIANKSSDMARLVRKAQNNHIMQQ